MCSTSAPMFQAQESHSHGRGRIAPVPQCLKFGGIYRGHISIRPECNPPALDSQHSTQTHYQKLVNQEIRHNRPSGGTVSSNVCTMQGHGLIRIPAPLSPPPNTQIFLDLSLMWQNMCITLVLECFGVLVSGPYSDG